MREIISPIKNPNWRWTRGPTFYQNMRIEDDVATPIVEKRKAKDYWIADVETYALDAPGKFQGDARIVCYSYRFFGGEPAIQTWGFVSDMEQKNGQMALCFDGKWFLLERADEITVEFTDSSPFDQVTISVKSRQGHKSVTIYKK